MIIHTKEQIYELADKAFTLSAKKKTELSGELGEILTKEYLDSKQKIYFPTKGKYSDFDMVLEYSSEKYLMEVKTKPRMFICNFTGFNTKQVEKYSWYVNEYYTDGAIIFIDWFEEKGYWGRLSTLLKGESQIYGEVTVFDRSLMKDIIKLNQKDVQVLEDLYTGNYKEKYLALKNNF